MPGLGRGLLPRTGDAFHHGAQRFSAPCRASNATLDGPRALARTGFCCPGLHRYYGPMCQAPSHPTTSRFALIRAALPFTGAPGGGGVLPSFALDPLLPCRRPYTAGPSGCTCPSLPPRYQPSPVYPGFGALFPPASTSAGAHLRCGSVHFMLRPGSSLASLVDPTLTGGRDITLRAFAGVVAHPRRLIDYAPGRAVRATGLPPARFKWLLAARYTVGGVIMLPPPWRRACCTGPAPFYVVPFRRATGAGSSQVPWRAPKGPHGRSLAG